MYPAKNAQPSMCQPLWAPVVLKSTNLLSTSRFPEEQTEAQKGEESSRVTTPFLESAIDRPGSELRLRAKHLDSDCTILAQLQAALWNSASIS